MSVSKNVSQPLCDSTQVPLDPTSAVPYLSSAVIKSNVAVSGLLELCCDSAHTVSDSVVQGGLSEEVCDSSHSAFDPLVPSVTAKGDFLGQRDLFNTQNRGLNCKIKRRTKDIQHCTETTKK